MAFETKIELRGVQLSGVEEQHIQRQLEGLERRLVNRPDPSAVLVLTSHPHQRQIQVDFRVQLGPLGSHLVSHHSADTATHGVRLAIDDIERQLERRLASQRGEPSYGVPSRREPWHHAAPAAEATAEGVED